MNANYTYKNTSNESAKYGEAEADFNSNQSYLKAFLHFKVLGFHKLQILQGCWANPDDENRRKPVRITPNVQIFT